MLTRRIYIVALRHGPPCPRSSHQSNLPRPFSLCLHLPVNMCLVGLLVPFKHKKESKKHRSKSSSHRRSERPHRERSERSRRREKDEAKDSTVIAEDALARLCLSLEQSLLDEQRSWRDQDRLDILERQRLGLERERAPFEEAPPYTFRDETARQPSPEPQCQTGVADSPECRNRDLIETNNCCRSCVCTRCGSTNPKCPTIPELDDTRVKTFTERGAERPRRRASAAGGPHSN
jgi:hypothetical protein